MFSSKVSGYFTYFATVVLTIAISISILTLLYLNLNSLGQTFKIENFGVKLAEKMIDSNVNFWSTYQNQFVSFKYPMYLSPFNNISATELTTKDEQVANYFRLADSKAGGYSGRSYWIVLMAKDPAEKTQGLDIATWVSDNKLDIDTFTKNKLKVEKIVLGGKDAYSVTTPDEKSDVPRKQTIYFQTRDGIASIGFFAYTPSNLLGGDYAIFKNILTTFTFL